MKGTKMKKSIGALVSALALTVTIAACADDGEPAAATGEPVTVTAVDYAFEGLPATVPVGTELDLTNTSAVELHEIVLVRVPDGEDRPVSELVRLPPEELMGMVMPNLVGVSLAPPNGDGMVVRGDLVLADAGRYMLLCVIPTGADPDEYLAAAEEAEDGPPQVDGGPPHIVHGMYAEVTAEG
jgi:hypothetical protein